MIKKIILDNEQLKTRADLVVFLKENGFNVSREVKGSISILPENEKKPIRISISVHASLDELRQKFQQSQHVTQNHNHDIDESQLIVLKQQLEKCKQRTYEHDRKRYFKHADSKKSKYSTAIHEQNFGGRSRNVNRNDVKNDRIRISKIIRKNSEQTAQIIDNLRATTKRNQQTIDDITREFRHQRKRLEYHVTKFNQRTGKAAFNGSGNESRLNLNKTSGYHHYFNQQQSLYQQKNAIIKEQKSIDFKVHHMRQKLNQIAQKITQCLHITLGSDDVPPMANKPVDEMTREEYIHYVLILMTWCLNKAQKSFVQQNQYLQTLSNEWRQYHSQWNALMKRNQVLNQKMNQLKELQQQCRQQQHQCAIHHDLVSELIEEKRFLSSISKYRSLSEK
ncbi:hypothetical protein [Wielerella bovis]|nr:hypothetical protein [Wielerella bovis]ULJ63743.1 hypothetical protein MIS33_06070 [Wielerella bovis]ULJ66089.1 hypothetical protein MIS31_07365 [Wielerella bovis]